MYVYRYTEILDQLLENVEGVVSVLTVTPIGRLI